VRIEDVSTNFSVSKQNFRGYVNGRYYEDWIISEAKKALKDTSWEKKFRKQRNLLRGYLNWHENIKDQGGLTTRILMGTLSLGMSEVFVGGFTQ